MKLSLALILSIFLGIGLVTFFFSMFQMSNERPRLESELENRISQLSDEISFDTVLFSEWYDQERKELIIDKLTSSYYLSGIAIFYTPDSMLVNTAAAPLVARTIDYIKQSMSTYKPIGSYHEINGINYYEFIRPVYFNNSILVIFKDAEYINSIVKEKMYRSLFRWLIQTVIISALTVMLLRWGVFTPINKIVNWVKAARTGNIDQLGSSPPASFLAPLHQEIVNITKAMQMARITAEEEALLRSKAEAIWTPERLKAEVQNLLLNKKMIVVSNREPYMHIHDGGTIKCIVPASGLITAMEPILNACGGLWIASGTGDADRETVDENGKIMVPPEEPRYTLKRLWQTKEEEIHFYYGFSNEGLWPLCHIAHTRPVFRMEDWQYYKKVNADFAAAVLAETQDEPDPFILIQDYHFALLPELIRKGKPGARIAIFWHIPWPNPESFGICPWQREILNKKSRRMPTFLLIIIYLSISSGIAISGVILLKFFSAFQIVLYFSSCSGINFASLVFISSTFFCGVTIGGCLLTISFTLAKRSSETVIGVMPTRAFMAPMITSIIIIYVPPAFRSQATNSLFSDEAHRSCSPGSSS